jgi:fumarate reductase subunit C
VGDIVKSEADYTLYHPKWYRPRVSVWWWLQRWSYLLFVVRELTSVFVAAFALVLLWALYAVRLGPDAYAHFLARLKTPPFLALNAVALLFVLYHAVAWLLLTPRAMIVRVRGRRLPDGLVVAANFVGWLVLSVAVTWALWRR